MRKREKLDWFRENSLQTIPFDVITPDKDDNWLNLVDNDFDKLIPTIGIQAIFQFHSLGVSTNRDEWVFDLNEEDLIKKIQYFCEDYNTQLQTTKEVTPLNISQKIRYSIKWSNQLKANFLKRIPLSFESSNIIRYMARPYHKKFYYADKLLSDRLTSNHFRIFSKILKDENFVITFSGIGASKYFSVLAVNTIFSLDLIEKTQSLPMYCYENGNRIDNITNWGLQQFRSHYQRDRISKEDIFHYTYAVLHHPRYRQKYAINLKREFPRIPFYDDFEQWAAWGRALMDLHLNYERVEPYPLKLQEELIPKERPKAKLRAIPPKRNNYSG